MEEKSFEQLNRQIQEMQMRLGRLEDRVFGEDKKYIKKIEDGQITPVRGSLYGDYEKFIY